MKAKFRIYLDELSNFDFSQISSDLYVEFNNVSDRQYFSNWFQDEDCLSIEIDKTNSYIQIDAWYSSGGGQTITSNFETLSTNGSYIDFTAECENYSSLLTLQNIGVINIIPLTDETHLYLYSLNSENNVLDKDLTIRTIINGKFNHSIGVKSLNIDVVNLPMNFNYVYIPSLKRYYYVDSVEIISNDVRRLHLKEDVLTSWKSLIKMQNAFITRKESGSNSNVLKDDRLPLEDKISYDYFDNIKTGVLKNVTFDYSTAGYRFVSLSFTTASEYVASNTNISAPASSGLPDIMPTINSKTCIAFMQRYVLNWLIEGIYADSSKASYVENIMWLPFDPLSVFDCLTAQYSKIYVGDKILGTNASWNAPSSTDVADCRTSQTMGSPYLIIADFTFNAQGGIVTPTAGQRMLYYNSYWEIYVPFVGWVNVDYSKVFNKRILVYYTIDMKTGISTAYIYNFTDKKVLYSTTCTLGIKVDFTTSNALENTKQKQANDLNMLISGLSSALSIGVGVATENPVAIAGGILSLGKSVAGYVNANNMIIERANTSFGTSNGALYSQNFVSVRRSYHAPISITSSVYASLQGYPANTYDNLSSLTGYIEIGEIHFKPYNETIYQDEITEIVSLLKDGVIF